jgi:hypothetical protein
MVYRNSAFVPLDPNLKALPLIPRQIYSTSQKFGHTYSFQGFSLFFTIFYIVE